MIGGKMSVEITSDLAEFQKRIGYTFRDASLLQKSLTHPSTRQDSPDIETNQRLEFLGDAVLQLIVTEQLHALYPDEREGPLTSRRASLTQGAALAQLARDLGIEQVLRVSSAARAEGGHERLAALEDATEAVAAAVYLDSDWQTAKKVVLGWFGDIDRRLESLNDGINPKGRLQELVQPEHGNNALSYTVIRTDGPPHDRRFEVEVSLLDRPLGKGTGGSKKEAEEGAAREALRNWPPPVGS
jgi:ribonuclease-3